MNQPRDIEVAGVRVPAFMYGTAWKEDATEALTKQALAAGFRAIDTANQRRHYVETGVGDAVAAAITSGAITRAELFLQTKFTFARGQDHRKPYDPSANYGDQVMQSFESSLEHLRTPYVDSYVLHGPEHGVGISTGDREVWSAMTDLAASGRARCLGISNVSAEQLAELCALNVARPTFVQNRCYARTGWDREVRLLCRRHGIVYQGFSLLTANRHVLVHPDVLLPAKRLGVSAAATIFRFAMDVGMLPLTGTTDVKHMRADLAVLDLPPLTDAERTAIEAIG